MVKNAGFSLLETIVALAIAFAATYWMKDQILTVFRLQNVIQDRNYLQVLEEDLRLSVLSDKAFQINAVSEPLIDQCLKLDQKKCPKDGKNIKLVSPQRKLVTGGFAGPGKSCSGEACPIQIEVLLSGVCEKAECDVAGSLTFDYTIKVDGTIYRHGFMQKSNLDLKLSDENSACRTDSQFRSEFAYRVGAGVVSCVPVPRPVRKFAGVKPGACELGKEILSGFGSDRIPICTKIDWK